MFAKSKKEPFHGATKDFPPEFNATNKYLLSAGYTLTQCVALRTSGHCHCCIHQHSPDAVCSTFSEPSKLQLNIQPTSVHLFFKCAMRHTVKWFAEMQINYICQPPSIILVRLAKKKKKKMRFGPNSLSANLGSRGWPLLPVLGTHKPSV